MRRRDKEVFEIFKGKLYQTQLNKKRTNREAGKDKEKIFGSVHFWH